MIKLQNNYSTTLIQISDKLLKNNVLKVILFYFIYIFKENNCNECIHDHIAQIMKFLFEFNLEYPTDISHIL